VFLDTTIFSCTDNGNPKLEHVLVYGTARLTIIGISSTTANIKSITGAGDASIYNCYNSFLLYSTASSEWSSAIHNPSIKHVYPTKIYPSKVIITTYTDTTATTSTRCDNVLFPPTNTATPIHLTFQEPWVSTNMANPTPPPKCTIPENKCGAAWDAFSTASYNYLSSVYSSHFAARKTDAPGFVNFNSHRPPCVKPAAPCPPKENIDKCSMTAAAISVFYWPVSVSDFCGEKVTVTPSPTIEDTPNTAMYRGTTITSPSVLVVVQTVYKYAQPHASLVENESDLRYKVCGYHYDPRMIVDPTDLTSFYKSTIPTGSYRQSSTWATRYSSSYIPASFDLADLQRNQVPADKHIFKNCPIPGLQPTMAPQVDSVNNSSAPTAQCIKIYLDYESYKPYFSLPSEISSVYDGMYAGCSHLPIDPFRMKYYPIITNTIKFEDTTRWGAQVTPGPRTSRIVPAVAIRIAIPTPIPVPIDPKPNEEEDDDT